MQIDQSRLLTIKPGDILVLTNMGDVNDYDYSYDQISSDIKSKTGASEVWLVAGDIAVLRKEVSDDGTNAEGG